MWCSWVFVFCSLLELKLERTVSLLGQPVCKALHQFCSCWCWVRSERVNCYCKISKYPPGQNFKVDSGWGLYRNNCSILPWTPTPGHPHGPLLPISTWLNPKLSSAGSGLGGGEVPLDSDCLSLTLFKTGAMEPRWWGERQRDEATGEWKQHGRLLMRALECEPPLVIHGDRMSGICYATARLRLQLLN